MKIEKTGQKNLLPLCLTTPPLTFLLTELYTYDPFADIGAWAFVWNLLFYWLTAALLILLTGRARLALAVQTTIALLAGLANYYVLLFRSSPILPWDIFSMETAATVADNFRYDLSPRALLTLAGFALLIAAELFWPAAGKVRICGRKIRLAGSLLSLACLSAMTLLLHQDGAVTALGLYHRLSQPRLMQERNGVLTAFLMELKYLRQEEPKGYDAAQIKRTLSGYGTLEAKSGPCGSAEKLPNIIVIMDEAFADMEWVGQYRCDREEIPFVRGLMGSDNVISGRLHVSVLGGNTANTEYEFLTGNTMAFLPYGSIPYQQYIKGPIPSLASALAQAGYETAAMHPYYATGWKRDKAYPWMGFSKLHFLEDYSEAEYIRRYVSDRSDFRELIRAYEARDKNRPLFLFNVTMQNHGGYDQAYDNFLPQIRPEGIESQALQNYLSLLSLTDRDLEELISYFAKEEDDTLLVFFGDHQPNDSVADPILEADGRKRAQTEAAEELRYQVPFLIWANYEIEEKQGVETSANFLALEVLEQAGIPRRGYYGYLEKLRERYPVVSAKCVMDADGRLIEEEELDKIQSLSNYRRMQYYQMFDAPAS